MVNIKDIGLTTEALDADWLDGIFLRQKELMVQYEEIEKKTLPCIAATEVPVDLNSYSGQHQVKERIFNCFLELAEAANCLKNKSWKQTMMETDVTHFKEEMADALHFFIEACILSGIGAGDLFDLYFRKSEVNKFRQRSNY